MKASIKNKYMELKLKEDLLIVRYIDKFHLTLEIAKDCVKDRLMYCDGKTYPLFVDMRNIEKVDEDAMSYLSKGEAIKYISAGAFLIESKYHKMLATAFIWFNRPPLPTKFFTDETLAIRWLEYYKYKYLN
jgi:hypothetical protein